MSKVTLQHSPLEIFLFFQRENLSSDHISEEGVLVFSCVCFLKNPIQRELKGEEWHKSRRDTDSWFTVW